MLRPGGDSGRRVCASRIYTLALCTRGRLCACVLVLSQRGAPLGRGAGWGVRCRPAPPSQTCRLFFSLGASALITHFIFCTCPDASRLHSSRLNVPVGSAVSKGTSGFQAEQSVSGNHDCPWTRAEKQLNLGPVTVIRGVGEAGVVVKLDRITREARGGPPSFPKPRQPRPSPCLSPNPTLRCCYRAGGCASAVTSGLLEIRGILRNSVRVCVCESFVSQNKRVDRQLRRRGRWRRGERWALLWRGGGFRPRSLLRCLASPPLCLRFL